MRGLITFLAAVSSLASGMPSSWCQQGMSSVEAFRVVSQGGVPSDWTHRHVFFSAASTAGTNVDDLRRDPRYWLQQLQRPGSQDPGSAEALDGAAITAAQAVLQEQRKSEGEQWDGNWRWGKDERAIGERKRQRLRRDWTQTFQTGGTVYTFSSPTYPAKFSFLASNPAPNCSTDYVVYTLPTGGSSFPGNFNIIAFNNLYVDAAGGSTFCPGTAPTAMFDYNASSAGGILNGSPALSLNGALIAFVENAPSANGGAVFHVLKWKSGNIQTVDTKFPAAFNGTALTNCTTNLAVAPCEYNLQYTPSASREPATLSSPFIDYATDTAYVSDDGGNVYAIAPVFTATSSNPPAVLSGWPVNVGASVILTPPVYDHRSKNVFVSSSTGTEFFVKTAASTTGSCLSGIAPCVGSNTFAFTGGGVIQEGSLVDGSTGRVWVFGTQTGGTTGSYVVQTDTALTAASVVKDTTGAGTLNVVRPGTPNNNYFTSVATGDFYVCGQSAAGAAELYAFGFNASGVMNSVRVTGSPLLLLNGNKNDPCTGAMTEVFNRSDSGGTDLLFTGIKGNCLGTGPGTSGCVMSFNITSAFPSTDLDELAGVGGMAGIIIDNVTDASSTKLTTNIYSILLGGQSCVDYLGSNHTGNCAVSATQSGLQ
jgi:hypothetical protein